MKSITLILKNITNLLPYFLLVAIYFFFVNLEARKYKNVNTDSVKEDTISNDKPSIDDNNLIIRIPVIPYNQ